MKTPAIGLVVCWFAWPFLADAAAQTALERLEQRLQQSPQNEPRPQTVPIEPGYLGIVTDDRQEQGRGVRVVEVLAGGPASKAGIQAGDLLQRVEDRPLRTNADLGAMIEKSAPGAVLKFHVQRGTEEYVLPVTFGKRPPPEERRFEVFGRQANSLELPAPTPAGLAPAEQKPAELPPVPGIPNAIGEARAESTKSDRARIDLLERRVAELERRLAELEQLLQRKP